MLPPGSDMAKQMDARRMQDIAEFKQGLGGGLDGGQSAGVTIPKGVTIETLGR